MTADQWQLIKHAPRDGSRFLAWTIGRGWGAAGPTYLVEIARWSGNYFASTSGATPTHWMPLPAPPVTEQSAPTGG